MVDQSRKRIEVVNPILACAKEYWGEILMQHDRVGSGWIVQPWSELSIETKRISFLRIHHHIESGEPVVEKLEHYEWVDLKRLAGWEYSLRHSPARKQHPMLRQFGGLAKWQKELTEIFCGTVRKYMPAMKAYRLEV